MKSLYEQGLTMQEVADRAGSGWKRVKRLLVEQGVPLRKGGRQTTRWPIPLEELYQRYSAGETPADLCRECGVSAPQTLTRAFADRGWSLRSVQETLTTRNRAARTEIDEDLLRELHATGMTYEDLAQALGTTHKVVYSAAKRLELGGRSRAAAPERNRFWQGGYQVDKHGYVLVRMPRHHEANHLGYVRVHRWVMEQQLGRPLTSEEVVDHQDRDTSNNDPSNLRLFPNNAEHLRVTVTGRKQVSPDERAELTRQAVLRARRRVAATLAALESDAHWSHESWPRPSTEPRRAAPRP